MHFCIAAKEKKNHLLETVHYCALQIYKTLKCNNFSCTHKHPTLFCWCNINWFTRLAVFIKFLSDLGISSQNIFEQKN